jgi:hypothetical protein
MPRELGTMGSPGVRVGGMNGAPQSDQIKVNRNDPEQHESHPAIHLEECLVDMAEIA